MHHLYIDHVKRDHVNDLYQINLPEDDQPAPMVNMAQICQLPDESLNTILEESPKPYSEGSIETTLNCRPLPPGFRGEIFHISHDSVAVDGETSEQCHAREARNADRQ